jgi:mono/diheme cytochrome c family protein
VTKNVLLLLVLLGWTAPIVPVAGRTEASERQSSQGSQASAAEYRAVLDKYCITCHNAQQKVAGLVLQDLDVAHPPANGAIWEKVIRKLRSSAMPPPGLPRPDAATRTAMQNWLESELDRAAVEHPDPGRLPLLHRLSRTEYRNAIRDLLALENLPKELDVTTLLPADNSASGFDNLAELLFVSPTQMERYLVAAQKISRLVVGDPGSPVITDTYALGPELPQDVHVEGLPLGTRGGMLIRSTVPVDGEYQLKLEFANKATSVHQIEISVDGERAQLLTIGDVVAKKLDQYDTDEPTPDIRVRIPLKAGPQAIGVAFVQHTAALSEAANKLRARTRGPLPAFAAITFSGPYNATQAGDTPSRRRLLVCHPANGSQEAACANQILSTLVRRAYRRPATDADMQALIPFYNAGVQERDFDMGIQRTLERVLVSPQFLFRIERDPARQEVSRAGEDETPAAATVRAYRISDLELASRLSFFIWSSIPDDELLDVAIKGKLREPAVLERQVKRMLADERSEALVTNFAAQWLYLRDIEAKRPDEEIFPDFDESLRHAMHRETELFLESIVREDHNVLDILRANYTFLNERLAKHYGIPNIYGTHFRRVTFPPGSVRGGLLGQGSILTLTSYATRTSAVVRGKWILENLLSAPPPPPPPNVPAFKATDTSGKALSMREAMEQHRRNPVCASCHTRMDPIGFALENYDAVGRWRTESAGQPIDSSGLLPDGTKFDGMAGLRELLLKRSEEFVDTIAEKLLTYAAGRNVDYVDAPVIRKVRREAAKNDYKFSSLVLGIVKSTPFQMRRFQP